MKNRPDMPTTNPSLQLRYRRGSLVQYLEKHRGRPQYRPAPQAAKAIAKVMRPLAKKYGGGLGALERHWPEIVGHKWANLSTPVRISGKAGCKTLLIRAQGPAASLLQADSQNILARVNGFLGPGHIRKISLKQGRPGRKAPVKTAQHLQKKIDPAGARRYSSTRQDGTLSAALDTLAAKLQAQSEKNLSPGREMVTKRK